MKIFQISMLLTFITVISCSKDDNVITNSKTDFETKNDSIVYFTLNVNEYWNDDDSRSCYIVLNDENGNLLDYKKVKRDTQYEFKAAKNEAKEKFTVTKLIKAGSENDFSNYIDIFYNIEQGTVWDFDRSRYYSQSETDETRFNLEVKGIYGWTDYTLSHQKGIPEYSNDTNPYAIYFYNVSSYANNKFMLTIHFDDKPSKYILLDNIKDGDHILVDEADLLSFDSSFEIQIPDDSYIYRSSVNAIYSNTAHFKLYDGIKMVPSKPNIFSLSNIFSKYRITVHTQNIEQNWNYSFRYSSIQPKDITVTLPDAKFTLINSSIDNFRFETNFNHTMKSSLWQSVNNQGAVTNMVWLSSNQHTYNEMPKFPTEVLQDYPGFDIEKLEYQSTYMANGGPNFTGRYDNSYIIDEKQEMSYESFRFTNPALKNKKRSINDLRMISFLNDQEINLLGRK